jgi:hypothetical protein
MTCIAGSGRSRDEADTAQPCNSARDVPSRHSRSSGKNVQPVTRSRAARRRPHTRLRVIALTAGASLIVGVVCTHPGAMAAPRTSDTASTTTALPAGQVAQQTSSTPAQGTGSSVQNRGPARRTDEPGGKPRTSKTTPPSPSTAGTTVTTYTESPGYLDNPGEGYQGWTHASGVLEQSTEYRRGEHPEQGGFDWASLNPREGAYNWGPIDTFLAECAARGEQGSFRIYTMNGEPYGTNRVPQWVKDRGAVIRDTPDLEPDYRNRTYQQHWGTFVDALARRYDGDPRIAFIDISGYGRFNEWQANSLTDDTGDTVGLGDTIDSSTRRHLVHMFVGGSGAARVVENDGVSEGALPYQHPGFQRTQLLMPYGGLWSSSRYVAINYPHVGFRNDALFSEHADFADFAAMGYGITDIWRTAPVVFEAVGTPSAAAYPAAAETLRGMGASFLHENAVLADDQTLTDLVTPLGYRYFLSRAETPNAVLAGGSLPIGTTWTNTGSARAYPRMGQDFALSYALADADGDIVTQWEREHGVSEWLPGDQQIVEDSLEVPDVAAGTYTILAGITERRTGHRIQLPQRTNRADGWYPVATMQLSR